MKEKLTYNILFLITIITLFSMTLKLYGKATFEPGTEPVSGYWQLDGSKTDVVNGSKITTWSTESNTIVGTSGWVDILKIEHTISSSYKWDEPQQVINPGSDMRLSGTYVNNEYSSTNKLAMGIRIYAVKNNEGAGASNQTDEEIIKISKDSKSHANEMKYGYFTAPRYYAGDNREMQLIIDCFIGGDHYITTYTYKWVES